VRVSKPNIRKNWVWSHTHRCCSTAIAAGVPASSVAWWRTVHGFGNQEERQPTDLYPLPAGWGIAVGRGRPTRPMRERDARRMREL
jgi:hypothetical protein